MTIVDTAPQDPWAPSNDYSARVAVAQDIASGVPDDAGDRRRPDPSARGPQPADPVPDD